MLFVLLMMPIIGVMCALYITFPVGAEKLFLGHDDYNYLALFLLCQRHLQVQTQVKGTTTTTTIIITTTTTTTLINPKP